MVYPQQGDDNLDRPRGILTEADRKYLLSDKSGYSYQAQNKRENAIRERVINALLDFAILENNLNEEIREDIFRHFDVNNLYADDTELYADEIQYVSSLTDMIAFLYRETKEQTGFNPAFARLLENGVIQGEFEPETTYYGNHKIDISFEKLPDTKVNIDSIIERVKNGELESLNEAEMKAVIEILSRSDSVKPSKLKQEFTEWVSEFEEENERNPRDLTEIFSQLDHGDPHKYHVSDSNNGE